MTGLLRWRVGLLMGALAAVGMLAAVACGAAEAPTPTPTTRPAATPTRVVATPTPTTAVPTPTPAPKPKYGGMLTRAQTSDPPTFDVHATSFSLLTNHTHSTHNRLIRYKTLAWPENAKYGEMSFVGDLAKSWDISADGKVFTFHLRPGVAWQNVKPMYGRTVNSTDVKASFERLMKKGEWEKTSKSVFAEFYKPIVSMETPDPLTLVMTIDRPLASWLYRVADGEAAWIVAADLLKMKGVDYGVAQDSLAGTGPFIPEKGEPGARFIYVRNDNYFDPTLPYVDRVQWLIIPDAATREAAFISGQVSQHVSAKPDDLTRIKKAVPDIIVTSDEGLAGDAGGLMFNMTKPLWKDVKVRQAINLAMDRERMIKDYFQGQAAYQSCIPNALRTYTLEQDELKKLYPYDTVKAKALLVEAGYPNGFTFELLVYTGYQQEFVDMSEMIQADLKLIGITVNIKPIPVAQGRPLVEAGNFDTVIQPHSTGVEPDEMFGGFRTGGGRNFARVSDPKVDAWAAQQEVEFDVAKRAAITKEFARYCATQALGNLVTPEKVQFTMTRGWVKNYPGTDLPTDEPRETFAWIER